MADFLRILAGRRGVRRAWCRVVTAAALAALALGGVAAPAPSELFDDIYVRAKAAEAMRRTIRARFTQTTVSSLLVKPVVAKGTIVGAKPACLLMTYSSPERKTIIMDGTRVAVFRGEGPAEQTDVTDIVKKVNHYFVNATPEDLRKSFTVHAFLDPGMTPPTYQIDLVAKRKQIRQGLERLQVWIGRESLLLSQIKMTFPGGDSDTIAIEDAQPNAPVPEHAFDVNLPPPARKR